MPSEQLRTSSNRILTISIRSTPKLSLVYSLTDLSLGQQYRRTTKLEYYRQAYGNGQLGGVRDQGRGGEVVSNRLTLGLDSEYQSHLLGLLLTE